MTFQLEERLKTQLEERLKTYMQENQQRDILISPEMCNT